MCLHEFQIVSAGFHSLPLRFTPTKISFLYIAHKFAGSDDLATPRARPTLRSWGQIPSQVIQTQWKLARYRNKTQ